jgi:uncharacterized protein (TIGR03066 family)
VCAVFTLAGPGVATQAGGDKNSNAAKIVGDWEVTKSEEAPPGATVEMTKDGKLITKATINGKALSLEGTYKVEGNKLRTVQTFGGKRVEETMTIKTLTDTKLVTQDEKGKIDEFKRKK